MYCMIERHPSVCGFILSPPDPSSFIIAARSCRPPDWTTRVLYKCPCGDDPVMVPLERQRQSYLDGAYWCSTTMSLLDFDGSVKYVWNPFTLAQLKEKLNTPVPFDEYLECVASKNDASCVPPTDRIFEQQQISLLSVYQRCLTNYQEQRWDQGAYLMFNTTLQKRYRLDRVGLSRSVSDPFGVGDCLLEQQAVGADNSFCLRDRFLKGTRSMDYFAYTQIPPSTSATSAVVDACMTFSGPSKSGNPSVRDVFKNCLEDSETNPGCNIPHMLWSGRSTNKIPVASQHAMNISDTARRQSLAQGTIDSARADVMKAIAALKNWDGSLLQITIFSTECEFCSYV